VIAHAAVETPARVSLGTVDLLLRDRPLLLSRIAGGDVGAILRTMIATIAIAMAIVGAALGSYRGGVQIAYAAIKLPIVLLATAALAAPALTAIGVALGRPARLAADLALVMSALAFGALLLCACTPLIMLARALDVSYHDMILVTVGLFGFAGLASLRIVVGALARERAPGTWPAIVGLCIVFVLVGGQLAWALRPYLVRPRAPDVVFVREVEGSLIDAVFENVRSSRGIYRRASAPLPGEAP
jgi:hypothetical protein